MYCSVSCIVWVNAAVLKKFMGIGDYGMTKIVMLGISGLDADLLRVYGPSLPGIRRLMLESPFLECRSSFPPQPASAWSSVYTGLNPANHGITGILSSDESANGCSQQPSRQKLSRSETFWDVARRAGKRVCVVNPLLADTALLNDAANRSSRSESFPLLLDSALISSLRKPEEFCHILHERTSKQAASGLKMFDREPWDIFFLQLDALDHAQHMLWRYSDPGDPDNPGRNTYAHLMPDFYRLFDRVIGSFRTAMQQECVLVVVSGYGFGRRCIQRLQINEWLRGQGLLTPRARSLHWFNRRYLTERGNARSAGLCAYLQSWDGISGSRLSLAHCKSSRHVASGINTEETLAEGVNLAGVSPFGGIRLNRVTIERGKQAYEQVRETLLANLLQLRVKDRRAVNWAKTREDVYSGSFIEQFPDILFELRSDFGVDTQLYVPLVTQDPLHRILSGERTTNGVLLLGNLPAAAQIPDGMREPSVEDVAPTILRMLGATSTDLDGKALVQLQPAKVI